MPYEVAITRCRTYEEEQVHAAVEAALQPLGGLARVVQPGQRVLLKLNLLSAHPPERAVTTHPAVVKAVVRMVQARGATPIVGDSPGGILTDAQYRSLLETTGIRRVIEETGCEWANFDDATVDITSDKARIFKRFTAVKAPLDADVIIALPKLKTHQFMFYTGAVKLLYGFLPGLVKAEYHLHAGRSQDTFANLLLDIHDTFPPALAIMDAVVGMEGNGPTYGTPCPVGLILASTSCTALDFVMTHLIGLNPPIVPTVRAALRRGSGPARLEDITLFGEDPAAVRVADFRQARTLRAGTGNARFAAWSSWLFSAWPEIDETVCKRCGTCAKHCPPEGISAKKGELPRIDLAACLRCYCCHELCPHDAVRIAGPRLRFPTGAGVRVYDVMTKVNEWRKRK
ncbi:MAG: DUF362 domain-containing protein [Armatimonadota bacterium]